MLVIFYICLYYSLYLFLGGFEGENLHDRLWVRLKMLEVETKRGESCPKYMTGVVIHGSYTCEPSDVQSPDTAASTINRYTVSIWISDMLTVITYSWVFEWKLSGMSQHTYTLDPRYTDLISFDVISN